MKKEELTDLQATLGHEFARPELLETALASTGAFVNRKDAQKLLDEVKKKVPPEKKKE